MKRRPVAILISGRGSNMAALIAATQRQDYPASIAIVISNRPEAPGLERAAAEGVATAVLDHRSFADRSRFDSELRKLIDGSGAELVACAGYMRIMTPQFVEAYAGRMINIHPALLPLYKGLDTHARALADGVRIHGCTVHFVTTEIDSGPIIAQAAVPVMPGDTPLTLAARVNAAELRLFPAALEQVAAGHVRLENGRVVARNGDIVDPLARLFSPPLPEELAKS
ncbi:MAG TPA: phosphoribosylglycinamide formyltransferase [Aestuariivirgaceae bacterium]|jgi:phosphoribosylglycinamide formyltransferase 1|nr:phosphoribosylglycinamide formyltransferase [Aestuariivirgaceae bacterium]